jgi:hypothetical protein
MGPLLMFAIIAGGATCFQILKMRDVRRVLRGIGDDCGLTDVTDSSLLWFRMELTGRSGPLLVRLSEYQRGKSDSATRIVVQSRACALAEMSLRPEGLGTLLRMRLLGTREIETGDGCFDELFFVEGSPTRVRAYLDAETRRLLERIQSDADFEIKNGELRADTRLPPATEFKGSLVGIIGAVLDVAHRMNRAADVAERLAENATKDPEPAVRRYNLVTLVREYGTDSGTREALRAACADSDPEIRLRAASTLGAEGFDVLLRLAADQTVDDVCAAEAVTALGRQLPLDQAQEILQDARRRHHVETSRACVAVLGALGGAAAIEVLKVLVTSDEALASDAAIALGTTGAPEAEAPLLDAVRSNSAALRTAAAMALGSVGSVVAVLPLHEAAGRNFEDRDFTRAARQAIAEIQSRVSGATPGQLSLTVAESGQVSLADAEGGRVSIAETEAGRVSLSRSDEEQ